MTSSSDQTISTSNSFPSTFPSSRAFKCVYRAILRCVIKDSNRQTDTAITHLSLRKKIQFLHYLQDIKHGKLRLDPVYKVFNREEGGVIEPNSLSFNS